jgi:N-carbamoylputrescine amidase
MKKRCAFVEWPEGLTPAGSQWERIRRDVDRSEPDILVTNEMPFGPWLASASVFDEVEAENSAALHERALRPLQDLNVAAVISSRPTKAGRKMLNEAFVLEGAEMRVLHRKQLFPNESGWYETSWFEADQSGYDLLDVVGIQVGALLCTELMFNEYARLYGRHGADLIVVPRATGRSADIWITAARMAAIVAGSYVASSNRAGSIVPGPTFGGQGFAFAPGGIPLGETSSEKPIEIFDLEVDISHRHKSEYPCYVDFESRNEQGSRKRSP